ncbi:MAG: hypothetical protein JW788_00575 [Candidatus Omnitrophica bacterium]|nr:hypothetical protein [Candidatus Omnitrophota bacterium]
MSFVINLCFAQAAEDEGDPQPGKVATSSTVTYEGINADVTGQKSIAGPGMEIVDLNGMKIIAPKGAKIRREANRIFFEDTGEYLARRFDEMEKRFALTDEKIEELRKEIIQLRKDIEDSRKGSKLVGQVEGG